MLTSIPIEFELAAIAIVKSQYPNCHFKLILDIEWDTIRFEVYYSNSGNLRANPCGQDYRNSRCDFSITVPEASGSIWMRGWWRNELLTLIYAPNQKYWENEDSDTIPRPYPDGKQFEDIAAQLYPLIQKYF